MVHLLLLLLLLLLTRLHPILPSTHDDSLAVQAALQPWSASIYTQLLQHGRQPDLTFHHLPPSLFNTAPSQSFNPLGLRITSSSGSTSSSRPSPAAAEFGLSTSFSLRTSSTVFKRPSSSLLAPGSAAAAAAGHLRSVGSYTPGGGFGAGVQSAAAAAAGGTDSVSSRGHLRSFGSYTPGFGFGTGVQPPAAAAAIGTTAAGATEGVPEGALLYDEVQLRYESSGSIVVGYYSSGSQELVLNPVKGCWCEAGDVLVALTRTSGKAWR